MYGVWSLSLIHIFKDLYDNESSLAATDYFYKLSCDSNYIRRQRIKKDMKWTTDTAVSYTHLDVYKRQYHDKAKDKLFSVLLLAMMIPQVATLIPLFLSLIHI